jgi:plastocyanin
MSGLSRRSLTLVVMNRPSSHRRGLLIGAAVAGLVLGACGGDGESTATVPADADLVVTAVPSIRWDADAYTAPAGDITVALVNQDSVRHDLVILDGDTKVGGLELIVRKRDEIDSGTITLEPGEYRVYCIVPGHGGMDSTLTVG